MKSISLNNYLDNKNVWTKRILGFESFNKKRDESQVEKEYNVDKYGSLKSFDFSSIEEYKIKEFALAGLQSDATISISLGDELFEVDLHTARQIYYGLIKSKVEKYKSLNQCELGCGYGYNLSYLPGNVYGGEYSVNAVMLGQKLGLDVRQFNYYNDQDYDFIKSNSTILTAHSLEQIPDASMVVQSLRQRKDKINYIVHFEPCLVTERTSLLGTFRNRYIELNDYNRNLIDVLKEAADIEILELQLDVIGINPLNSSNMIIWRFSA